MKLKLGLTVLYAVLANEAAQSFVAATGGPVGEAVIQPLPYPGGFRTAHVVGLGAKEQHATLAVYKLRGDPYRGDSDMTMQTVGDVPYSKDGIPGTWCFVEDGDAIAAKLSKNAEVLAAKTARAAETERARAEKTLGAAELEQHTVEQLKEAAVRLKIDLGAATKKADIIAALTRDGHTVHPDWLKAAA